ncbi:MAG: DUF1080 domain-containing protein [Chloroflexi bacterium]|nr:DUF1080 domain-containing protein [Chloroflexota bacterium]
MEDKERAEGFVPLFDGRTLNGWEFVGDSAAWSAQAGEIHCSGQGRGWLRTARTYRDFVLRLEYAICPGGNSGIFLRSQLEGRPAYNGMEVQILEGHPLGVKSTGAIYDAVAPAKHVERPAGEWNEIEATCDGGKVAIVLNGERIVGVDSVEHEALRGRPREGYIGVQNHRSPVKFRRIYVKEL